jgi:histidyl-tRNA synthetase
MRDILPNEAEKLRFIEKKAREIARLYGYKEVITPIIENYDLLAAKIGEKTRNRMYTFEDQGGRRIALRPEFTASTARLVATKMMSTPKPIKLFSTGSLYRYDEPQFGRYREFWQANYELIGSSNSGADAEIILLTHDLAKNSGIHNCYFKIGHVGILRGILNQEGIIEDHQNNIMQLLDKKEQEKALDLTQKAGGSKRCLQILKNLFKIKSEKHEATILKIKDFVKEYPEALDAVKNLSEILNLLGTNKEIKIILEAGFARGLDYYTGIIFEVYVPTINVALGGGGRYDNLIGFFGAEKIPAVGIALGIDRFVLAINKQKKKIDKPEEKKVIVIPINKKMVEKGFKISSLLRKKGLCVEMETMGRTISRALSDADRRGFSHAIIIGSKEVEKGKVIVRIMKKRRQNEVDIKTIFEEIFSD